MLCNQAKIFNNRWVASPKYNLAWQGYFSKWVFNNSNNSNNNNIKWRLIISHLSHFNHRQINPYMVISKWPFLDFNQKQVLQSVNSSHRLWSISLWVKVIIRVSCLLVMINPNKWCSQQVTIWVDHLGRWFSSILMHHHFLKMIRTICFQPHLSLCYQTNKTPMMSIISNRYLWIWFMHNPNNKQ